MKDAEKNSTEPKERDTAPQNAGFIVTGITSREKAKEKGIKRYYTAELCMHGHRSERLVCNSRCLMCANEKGKERYRRKSGKLKKKAQEYRDSWSQKKMMEVSAQRKKYREENRERLRIKRIQKYYRDVEKSRKYARERMKNLTEEGREAIRVYQRERRKINPNVRIGESMREMISRTLNKKRGNGSSARILGYTRSDLRRHIERQFTSEMTWDNKGDYWEVDHITPVSKMIKDGITDPSVINALSNLRPITKKENREKSDKETHLI